LETAALPAELHPYAKENYSVLWHISARLAFIQP
jgi:hypothetical protein